MRCCLGELAKYAMPAFDAWRLVELGRYAMRALDAVLPAGVDQVRDAGACPVLPGGAVRYAMRALDAVLPGGAGQVRDAGARCGATDGGRVRDAGSRCTAVWWTKLGG